MSNGPLRNQLSAIESDIPYSRRYSGVVIFSKPGDIILQSRDNKPGIVNPGMTTLFGGGQNATETPEECIVRELAEELGLTINPASLQFLGYIDKEEADASITRCSIFSLQNIAPTLLHLHEGRAIAVRPAEAYFEDPLVSDITKLSIRAALEIKQL